MGWKTPPECLNTFAFIACSLKAGATLPWPSRRDEVRCYTQRRLAHEVWSNQLKAKVILIYINQASKDTQHHFVTCWFDKIMFAGSNHLLILINSWLKLLTGIWFAGSGSQCALWSLWDCTHLRATQRSHEPTLLGSGPWDNLGSSGAFAWFAVLPYLWLPTGRANLSFPWVDFGRFCPVKICQEQWSVHVATGLVSKAHIPLAASPLAPPGLGSEKEYSAVDWWF